MHDSRTYIIQVQLENLISWDRCTEYTVKTTNARILYHFIYYFKYFKSEDSKKCSSVTQQLIRQFISFTK